jgi:hypothetical protein
MTFWQFANNHPGEFVIALIVVGVTISSVARSVALAMGAPIRDMTVTENEDESEDENEEW